MKLLLVGILSLASLSVLANKDKDWDKMPFDQQKQMKLRKLEKKSAIIQEARECMTKATDKSALKSCWQEMEQDKQAMKESWKNKKKQSEEAREGLDVE